MAVLFVMTTGICHLYRSTLEGETTTLSRNVGHESPNDATPHNEEDLTSYNYKSIFSKR